MLWLLNLETDSDFTYSPWSSHVAEVCLEGCSELLSCDWFREIFLWAVIVLGTSTKWLVLKWPWITQWNYQRECVLCLSFRLGHSHMIFSHVYSVKFCWLFIYYSQKLWLEKNLRRASKMYIKTHIFFFFLLWRVWMPCWHYWPKRPFVINRSSRGQSFFCSQLLTKNDYRHLVM